MSIPYIIDFTDPLKASFSIPQAGFDGPGGSQSNTTLRLYGRGALEWGEAVDENLVRLTENFSSASAPLNPIDGQIWRKVKLYWHNTTAGPHAGWYSYNQTTHTWGLIGGTGILASTSAAPAIGGYYYDSVTSILYRYDSRYKQAAASWFVREYTASTINPSTAAPETSLLIYSEGKQQWVHVNPSIASPSAPLSTNTEVGALWYDTVNSKLKTWNGTVWTDIATTGGNLNWGGGSITGLSTQTYPLPDSNDAATINYVNDGLVAAINSGSLGGLVSLGNGIVVKTGASTYANRALAQGTGILVTNSTGTGGNPSIAVDTSVIATQAYVNASISTATGTVTVEPVTAGIPSNSVGANGDIRYQY